MFLKKDYYNTIRLLEIFSKYYTTIGYKLIAWCNAALLL